MSVPPDPDLLRRDLPRRSGAPARDVAPDEATLLAAARAGDRDAFDRLAVRMLPRLLGSARRLLRDPLEAEEAVAATLVRTHQALAGFRGASALSTWAHRILCRIAADRLRTLARQRRREQALPDDDVLSVPRSSPLARLGAAEERELVRVAIDRLPPTQRTVLVLVAWEGLELAEVARILDMRYATAKSNLHHAREALRARLGTPGEDA